MPTSGTGRTYETLIQFYEIFSAIQVNVIPNWLDTRVIRKYVTILYIWQYFNVDISIYYLFKRYFSKCQNVQDTCQIL